MDANSWSSSSSTFVFSSIKSTNSVLTFCIAFQIGFRIRSAPISSLYIPLFFYHRSHLIFQILHHPSQKFKLSGESLHLKGVLCFRCRGVVIFRHLWMFKNWLATSKIYAHNSNFFTQFKDFYLIVFTLPFISWLTFQRFFQNWKSINQSQWVSWHNPNIYKVTQESIRYKNQNKTMIMISRVTKGIRTKYGRYENS